MRHWFRKRYQPTVQQEPEQPKTIPSVDEVRAINKLKVAAQVQKMRETLAAQFRLGYPFFETTPTYRMTPEWENGAIDELRPELEALGYEVLTYSRVLPESENTYGTSYFSHPLPEVTVELRKVQIKENK